MFCIFKSSIILVVLTNFILNLDKLFSVVAVIMLGVRTVFIALVRFKIKDRCAIMRYFMRLLFRVDYEIIRLIID